MDEALRSLIRRREEIIVEVRRILVDDLHVQRPADGIELDAALFGTGLGLDSVDAVELVVATEERFGIALPADVLQGTLRSINTLVDLVIELDGKLSAPKAAPVPEAT
jgi:acyl carrier protein